MCGKPQTTAVVGGAGSQTKARSFWAPEGLTAERTVQAAVDGLDSI